MPLSGAGIGVDLGGDSVKVVWLRSRGKTVQVSAAPGISREQIADAADEDGVVDPEKLREALAASRAKIRGGVLGISGKDLMLRYMHIPPCPRWKLATIMDYEIQDASGGSEDISTDYRILNVPRKDASEFTILTSMAKNTILERRLETCRRAKMGIGHICPDAAGLFNAFLRSAEADPEEFSLLLDIGADKAEMVIVTNRNLIFARSISPAGRDFTRAIQDTLKIDFDKAEEIKRNRGEVLPESAISQKDGEERDLYQALHRAARQLCATVQSSIMFCKAQTKLMRLDVDRIYLSGGGARLRGLPHFISTTFDKPVEELSPFKGMEFAGGTPEEIEKLRETPSDMVIATGLAMTGMDETTFSMDLLPEREKQKRVFYDKTVYNYVAAAFVLVLMVFLLVGAARTYSVAKGNLAAQKAMTEEGKKKVDEVTAILERTERTAAALQKLSTRVVPGHALMQMTAWLRQEGHLPPEIRLTSISASPLRADERGGSADTEPAIIVRLKGYVQPSTRGVDEVVEDFKTKLDALAWAGDSKLESSRSVEAPQMDGIMLREFDITLPVESKKLTAPPKPSEG